MSEADLTGRAGAGGRVAPRLVATECDIEREILIFMIYKLIVYSSDNFYILYLNIFIFINSSYIFLN